ncbi:MAG: 3-phosphoshikimate 1-carboxyvinyltransferase [Coriobacteriia bacterium]|nr:3-phosphoshikimate 1-carboxyvinyltransferase [Coriobacteriia bacterium]
MLICAALAEDISLLTCACPSADVWATYHCLNAIGADMIDCDQGFDVWPIKQRQVALEEPFDLPCGESGTTLRLLLPIVAALGRPARFHRSGRLPQRPLSPLYEELVKHGCVLSAPTDEPLTLAGQLEPGDFCLDGGVSSQFISGLLFALPLLSGPSTLRLTGTLESRPYVDLTLEALRISGVDIGFDGTTFSCRGPQAYRLPEKVAIEGDWSSAAFWLCAGALGRRRVTVTGLSMNSLQGDRAVVEMLCRFGARIKQTEGAVTVRGGALRGIEIDAHDTPDLVPALVVVAAAASGQTVITGAARLRLKESDRLAAICDVLGRLGADIKETDEGLLIQGGRRLHGATIDAWGDHRIAMMAAVASRLCKGAVTITGAEAVDKSYSQFFEDLEALGGRVSEEKG